MENGWRKGLRMENNLFYTDGKPVTRWLITTFLQTLAEHQQTTGLDATSIFTKPDFVNPTQHDYRLKLASPGLGLGAQGAPNVIKENPNDFT